MSEYVKELVKIRPTLDPTIFGTKWDRDIYRFFLQKKWINEIGAEP